MPIDYPSQLKFEHMLSYTFPGLFSASSFFMAIDYLSPVDFLSTAIKDLNSLITLLGFFILFGTILGVIIDGLHHSFIEDLIFDDTQEVKKLVNECEECIGNAKIKLDFDTINKIDDYLLGRTYYYSEFFSNTFISLLPFSLILPFYLTAALHIKWSYSMVLSIISFVLACLSLFSGYKAYVEYRKDVKSIHCYLLTDKTPSEPTKPIEKRHDLNIKCVEKYA